MPLAGIGAEVVVDCRIGEEPTSAPVELVGNTRRYAYATLTRRPTRRLRLISLRPLWVRMRVRKPLSMTFYHLLALVPISVLLFTPADDLPSPPVAKKIPHVTEINGQGEFNRCMYCDYDDFGMPLSPTQQR